ncbi:cytochrome-c peroxidase [Thiothrix subterranea]|uniref:Cytochrome c peroxidase n=1 Tax=Thiothrix subterranea TaxID=2735563 RepID=A0AA51MIZ8_9GAMM|nr:cytochrome c peroxidase [Thiothrix subterranea]MDQ5768702.1 cytochrome c peroxidase [Thiothrix subterranea]WML84853.1 cytochrome c peroxidase [Thiothrix subterranea]
MPIPKLKPLARRVGAVAVGMAFALGGYHTVWAETAKDKPAEAKPAKPAEPAKPAGPPDLLPLPDFKPPEKPDMVELGKHLFFDKRVSGDWGVSCASCHDPKQGFGDGMALSAGYPSMLHFRNAPTLLNSKYRNRFMWDGRLEGKDMGTLVRDMVTETHTMNMDGRLVQERLKQIPEYVALWEKAFEGKSKDPYGPNMFNVIGEFVKTVESQYAPFDFYKEGDANALTPQAKLGYDLFKGKANCVSCHNGPIGSDGKLHRLGVPENPEIMQDPLRSITMLRHYSTSGLPNYMNTRTDVGFQAISKDPKDAGKFQTAPLRDLKYTAPYMHNGMLATLEEVIDFYDKGGAEGSALKPLSLSADEKAALKEFLLSLSGEQVVVNAPKLPDFKPREFGKN